MRAWIGVPGYGPRCRIQTGARPFEGLTALSNVEGQMPSRRGGRRIWACRAWGRNGEMLRRPKPRRLSMTAGGRPPCVLPSAVRRTEGRSPPARTPGATQVGRRGVSPRACAHVPRLWPPLPVVRRPYLCPVVRRPYPCRSVAVCGQVRSFVSAFIGVHLCFVVPRPRDEVASADNLRSSRDSSALSGHRKAEERV